jgi:hypothetical protein
MSEFSYDGSLKGLLTILDRCRDLPWSALPDRIRRDFFPAVPLDKEPIGSRPAQLELWRGDTAGPRSAGTGPLNRHLANSGVFPETPFPARTIMNPQGSAAWTELSGISVDACGHFLNSWMSELSIEAELIRFAWKILNAAKSAEGGVKGNEGRLAAERIVSDRCDPDAGAVLETSWKVWKETDRLFGLLRFSPNSAGVHSARCSPDHFVLPALADHFALRFGGGTPWAIIDERRGITLYCAAGGAPLLTGEPLQNKVSSPDPWEDLWRGYHQTINNESRSNPDLQRQFMPRRYWKYLPEMR